ncbi:MAG: pyruvate, phosphate dikinase [Deltaproteobacteria bacterium]|nr:pyruvate, phosphate dikinase [Deltaproteobacteria bacterium]
MTDKHVYLFDDDLGAAYAEPQAQKDLLGGKGAGLMVMRRLGIPVPPGFTITTEVCNHFRTHDQSFPDGLEDQVREALKSVEAEVERGFGDAKNPLLVSVRSGARKSMPGMMDTILNLGLTDETVEGLAEGSGDRRFAFDAYRRLLQMYGDVVLGVDHSSFEQVLGDLKRELGSGRMLDSEIPTDGLEELVKRYKKLIASEGSTPFPQDVWGQLWGAVGAVFESWDNQRAIRYRRMQGFSDDWGTACNVQAMVFGNMGETSGSGVCFTRNPSTGEKMLYGEYLPNAQGEDVVAGIRTPLNITAKGAPIGREDETLERKMPEVFQTIVELCAKLEAHYGDMQDVELTVERGKAWVLQTRTGKRAAHAAVRIAKELVDEGVLTREQALMNVDASMLDQLLHARLPTPEELEKNGVLPVASGLPASPGAATGKIVFDADHAEEAAKNGEEVILVRRETSPEDIHGMKAAQGIVTATGGMTSHAAVVARGLGKCCVAGCSDLQVDYDKQQVIARRDGGDAVTFNAGDVITLDGTHGKVYGGALDVVAAAKVPELETLMEWADEVRTLRVRANADTPRSARLARSYGAEGIGLCRTEHMFFADERLEAVRCVVLASSAEKRQQWLARVEPMQQQDFAKIFKAMDGLPVTVRLLDWPLHEFLPREEKEYQAVADALLEDVSAVKARSRQMHEVNPMLGHRAVRVGLTMPAIYEMQVRALIQAALDVSAAGVAVHPEIMIPVVGIGGELARMRKLVDDTAKALFEKAGRSVEYHVGTMIELPRACLVAGELAESAEFFSFGTNDLTQTTFGISRDDAGRFLPTYIDELQILKADPFARLDESGVGELVAIACERGRAQRPDIKLGLCGEHGGDPPSIDFCHRTGLAYVSCSPPRLPIARLAAAQAALRNA